MRIRKCIHNSLRIPDTKSPTCPRSALTRRFLIFPPLGNDILFPFAPSAMGRFPSGQKIYEARLAFEQHRIKCCGDLWR